MDVARFPRSQYDPCTVAVLWSMAPEACLSYETAIAAVQRVLCEGVIATAIF